MTLPLSDAMYEIRARIGRNTARLKLGHVRTEISIQRDINLFQDCESMLVRLQRQVEELENNT